MSFMSRDIKRCSFSICEIYNLDVTGSSRGERQQRVITAGTENTQTYNKLKYSLLNIYSTCLLGQKINMWVSGFPTLPSFWMPKSRPKTFLLDHACKCFHLDENVCGK